MLEINKRWDEHTQTYIIKIFDGKQLFQMIFAGNLDLYWNIYDLTDDYSKNTNVIKKINITKENYVLYSAFERLFYDIKNCNVYDDSDFTFCETLEERQEIILRRRHLNEILKNKYSYQTLFHDNCIEWHCDDYCYEEGNIVKIKKKKEYFEVSFQMQKIDIYKRNYSVRFRNSGSNYDPFNIIFMKMYNGLQKYDPEYHQIHMEEYLYQKRLNARRKK
jgi:hypothetical protein